MASCGTSATPSPAATRASIAVKSSTWCRTAGAKPVLGGEDPLLSPLLALGAHGAIAASAQVAAVEYVRLVAHWHAGDVTRARSLGHRLAGLSAALFAEPNPSAIKSVLHARGRIPTPSVRLPLLPASQDATRRALRRLEELTSEPR
ncbi:dihydrodipicolinate synthase family protein [Micromonospora sp. DT4]|uniref:dihydrodipicolinate synthase family protein n=1 Tax=Micromonospora sp. DT4 TaxID=3393438 RepID=UPI003CE9E474